MRRGKYGHRRTEGDGLVRMEAEIGAMLLEAKELQGLQAASSKARREAQNSFLSQSPEGSSLLTL